MTTTADTDRSAEVTNLAAKYANGLSSPSAELSEIWEEVQRLGLAEHIGEIEARGYTIIPPEKVGPPEFGERLLRAILDVVQRRTGHLLDVVGASEQGGTPFGLMATYLLFEDPVFQEAAVHPVALPLLDYFLGRSAILGMCQAYIKGPGGHELPLHNDNVMFPAPYPPYEQHLNISWLLTDYSRENGSTFFVPGSNQFGRAPQPGEGLNARVPVEARAGSLMVWPGSTWHGAYVKQTPGLRIPLMFMYSRMYLRTQEPYDQDVTKELLDSNPPRFATLMGQHQYFGYREEGIDFQKVSNLPGKSFWD